MWNQLTRLFNEYFYRLLVWCFPPTAKPLLKNPQQILIFSTTGIGDSLFDSAAIKSIKQGYPSAKVIVVTHHRRSSVAAHNPFVDEVIGLSKSPFSQLALLRRFWRKRPDLVVALRVNEEVVPLGYLLGRHNFVGAIERCQRLAFLLSYPVVTKHETHIVEETLKVATVAGGATVDRGMIYQVKQEEREAIQQRYPQLNKMVAGRAQPYLVFQTGGGKTLSWRNWPVESYIQLIHGVQQRYSFPIILTGGDDNVAVGKAIEAACPGVINAVQQTTLEETAALLEGASLLLSTDTGVMHLGFAVGCPTLALLHYRSPANKYGPLDYSPGHEILELPLPTRPIVSSQQDSEMKNLTVEQVTAAIQRMLIKVKAYSNFP